MVMQRPYADFQAHQIVDSKPPCASYRYPRELDTPFSPSYPFGLLSSVIWCRYALPKCGKVFSPIMKSNLVNAGNLDMLALRLLKFEVCSMGCARDVWGTMVDRRCIAQTSAIDFLSPLCWRGPPSFRDGVNIDNLVLDKLQYL